MTANRIAQDAGRALKYISRAVSRGREVTVQAEYDDGSEEGLILEVDCVVIAGSPGSYWDPPEGDDVDVIRVRIGDRVLTREEQDALTVDWHKVSDDAIEQAQESAANDYEEDVNEDC